MAQSGPHGQGNSAEDGLLLLGIALFFIGGFLFAAWWFFHGQISAAVMMLQHWMMVGAGFFTDRYAGLDAQVLATDPAGVRIGALWRLVHNVGDFYRWPAAALIAALGVACLIGNAPGKFTRSLDLRTLMRTQAEVFRSSAAFVSRGLGLTAVADGAPRPADPALHVREWIRRFALDRNGHYSEHVASAELTLQLGLPWKGVAAAAPHERAMLAVFALHAQRERSKATELLGDMCTSLPDGKRDGPAGPPAPLAFSPDVIAKADAVLADPKLMAVCSDAANSHAYTAPALMSVLTHAREQAGVLAPAQFAFLKLVDRRLWYALHSLGFPGAQNRAEQPNPRIEAIGARDHWNAECELCRPLTEPSLARALAVIQAKATETTSPATPNPRSAA